MPSVRCKHCGGSHPAWECKEPVVVARRMGGVAYDEPEPIADAEVRGDKVPWVQPLGVCASCDRRRADNARRAVRHRERT